MQQKPLLAITLLRQQVGAGKNGNFLSTCSHTVVRSGCTSAQSGSPSYKHIMTCGSEFKEMESKKVHFLFLICAL